MWSGNLEQGGIWGIKKENSLRLSSPFLTLSAVMFLSHISSLSQKLFLLTLVTIFGPSIYHNPQKEMCSALQLRTCLCI